MKIIENVISDTYSKHLEEQIKYIDWYYKNTTALSDNASEDQFSFSHNLISNNTRTNHADIFTPLILECISKCGISLDDYYIVRARLGLITKLSKKIIHDPHIDYDITQQTEGNLVILYYVNESDGDTYFYKGEHNEDFCNEYKRNSLILFEGNILHSSSSPIRHNNRVALNINLFKR